MKGSLYNLRLSLSFTLCSVKFLFQPGVYYKCNIFKNDIITKFWVKENFLVSFKQILSDSRSNIYISVSGDDGTSEYSSDSDNVNIRPIKRQKTLVIDSDVESENETHQCRRMLLCFCGRVNWRQRFTKIGKLYRVSGVTIECNNLQSVSEITDLIFGQPK